MILARGHLLMILHSSLCIFTYSFSDNGFRPIDNIGNHDFSCFGTNTERLDTSIAWSPKSSKVMLSFGRWQSVVTGLILVMVLLNIIVFKLRQLYETTLSKDNKPPSYSQGNLCRHFLLSEMRLATNNFDQAMVIGKGGFGKVYKGFIDCGAVTVAIKRLDSRSKQGATEFWTEIKMLSKFRHSNLVSLIGYCDEFDEMMIVYEYISGGNLGERLHKVDGTNKSPLSWVERLKICIGAARALDYLHTGTGVRHRIIHRDVKSSNILLDDYMAAKVSDLGVSKIGPVDQSFTHVSTDVKGSFGYLDPNYFMTRRLTKKSDVYSLGVVLLEVLCGRPAVDPSLGENEIGLVSWAQGCIKKGMLNHIIDPSLRWVGVQIMPDCLKKYVGIAEKCIQSHPKDRPSMTEVVIVLENALVRQERWNISNQQEQSNSTGKLLAFSRVLRNMLPVKTPRPGTASQELNFKAEVADPALKIFTLAGLEIATRNFSHDMILGEGGFGKVFKGWVEHETFVPSKVASGMPVAVKKLNAEAVQGYNEWKAEVNILGRLSHPNVVKLLGYCSEDNHLLLVYEFMPEGSMDTHLIKRGERRFARELSWSLRLKIMIGTARGLAFLHKTVNQIIFRDVKSSNILLDQDFNAKITDFGLAKHGPINGDTHLSTRVMGTYGYAAPEYITTGHLNKKSDIYAFGVVLLETLTGLQCIDTKRPKETYNLVEWTRPMLHRKGKVMTIVDPSLGQDYPPKAACMFAALALKCIQLEPKRRPSIEQVLQSLEQISGIGTGVSCMQVNPVTNHRVV